MLDDEETTTALDRKFDQILHDIGLDPDGPDEQYTRAAGLEFGTRLVESLEADPSIIDEFIREFLTEFSSIFPVDPDAGTIRFQAFLLGPLVSMLVAGRGLTLPEMAVLTGVSPQRIYRLHREALKLIYDEKEPPVRTGVNRRFSGRDERETHHVVDPHGFTKKSWPAPADAIRPFAVGMMTGLEQALKRPELQERLRPRFLRAVSDLLLDPSLRELMDGMILAVDRIAQGLRDTAPGQPGPILKMKAERERTVNLQAMLDELSRQRPAVLAELVKAGQALRSESPSKQLSLPA
jgi:hypothetical protein